MLMTHDTDHLYQALLAREDRYDGQIWVGVRSTGIFCRLSCPARKPKRENCSFHDTIAACLAGGFRPCKRCDPLGSIAADDPQISALMAALEADPTRRWTEADLTARGYDPSSLRRKFKRVFGQTFLDLARQRRLAAGFTALRDGARVIDAQHAAGFDSASAFRDRVARMTGLPPAQLQGDARLKVTWCDTALGAMIAVADDTHLHLLEFADRKALPSEMRKLSQMAKGQMALGETGITARTRRALTRYFDGASARFDVPLAFHGSAFTRQVWQALLAIPPGESRSYGQIAAAIGRPTASRAVARANGANQIAILIPCHRVIGADGSLTGYGGGLWRKDRLLKIEQAYKGQGS